MTLGARCADCNKGYRIDERLAGRTLRCKACGGTVAVPEMPAGAAPRVKIPVPVPVMPSPDPATVAAAPLEDRAAIPVAAAEADAFGNMDALLSPEDEVTAGVEDDAGLALTPPPLPRSTRRGGGRPAAAIDAPAYAPVPTATAPRRQPGWKPSRPAKATAGASSGAVPLVLGMVCLALGGVFVAGQANDSFRPTAFMILLVSGVGLMLAGGLGCLVTAFRESVVCGILYLFTPLGLYALYYIFTRLERTKGYLALYLIGLVCAIGSRGLKPGGNAHVSGLINNPVASFG
jgi:hypothetical protein